MLGNLIQICYTKLMRIIDVGSCVGVFIDDCLEKYDVEQIYAFEPLAANYSHLREKYRDNKRVEILQKAVSNFSGAAQFYKKPYVKKFWGVPYFVRYDFAGNAGSSLKQKSNVSERNSDSVEVVKLSDFIRERDLGKIDILKIDSEGSEYDILHDLLDAGLMDRIDKVYFEDHVRKVSGLSEDQGKFIERVKALGIEDKFFVQNVVTGDDLAYVPLKDVYEADWFRR